MIGYDPVQSRQNRTPGGWKRTLLEVRKGRLSLHEATVYFQVLTVSWKMFNILTGIRWNASFQTSLSFCHNIRKFDNRGLESKQARPD